jgi:acetylornithine deacetylase/succinyl-diaminopimelate desuccinylase-like protein
MILALTLTLALAAQPSPLLPEVVNATTEVMEALFPGVRQAPSLSNGASDSAHLCGAGVPSYGVSGSFTDVDDLRSHGSDVRVRVVDFYDGVEFAYRLTRRLGLGGRCGVACKRQSSMRKVRSWVTAL